MSDKTRKKRAELLSLVSLLAAGLILPAAGSLPEPMVVPSAESAEKTSEQRVAAGLYQLGVMRMNGEEGEQDISAGRYWIHLAARHGYPLAQYNLGVMYFDGIGGEYNRPCAQWWLTRAAGQDDTEVHQMAEQALQDVLPEMAGLPKVYRPVTAAECDRLPEWRSVTDIDVLPPGDIDTGKRVIIQEEEVPEQEAEKVTAEAEAPVPVITSGANSSSDTDKITVQESPAETDVAPVYQEASAPAGSGTDIQDTVTDNETEIINESDRGDAGKTDRTGKAEVSADNESESKAIPGGVQLVSPATDTDNHSNGSKDSVAIAGQTELSGAKKIEKAAEDIPETGSDNTKKLKSPVVGRVPVLNLGGSPATAPGKHYTLQLSGGTTADELYRIARRHKLDNYIVYETERHGRRWYVLVAGEYATLTAANQALKGLKPELRRNGPWVRSIRQVQDELKK